MITKDSIESAYCFFHQKYAISSYVDSMNKELYDKLAAGREGFLLTHSTFASDMQEAIKYLSSFE